MKCSRRSKHRVFAAMAVEPDAASRILPDAHAARSALLPTLVGTICLSSVLAIVGRRKSV